MDPFPLIIGGEYKNTQSTIPVLNPYSDERIGDVCRAGAEEIEEVMIAAGKGAKIMASLPAHIRSSMLHRLADLIEESSAGLTDIIISESGKVRRNAAAEVMRAVRTIRISAEEALRIRGETIPMDTEPAGEKRWAILIRVPVGIVLAICPFNFPLNLICHKAGPAYASGNACIIKPSSDTPLTALKFGELLLRSGFPKEAVNVVSCDNNLAECMVMDQRVGCISFTGSPQTGWHLRHIANTGKVSLELGGNAAVIVNDTPDISLVARRIVEGAFTNAGQVCISVQRVYVNRSIYNSLADEIVNQAATLVLGDPADPRTDIGPMINQEKCSQALRRISDAEKCGARILCGSRKTGRILVPSVIGDTNPTMEIEKEEVFAPVLTIKSYDSFQDAIDMVNDTKYGLQAGVYTQDLTLAFSACQQIRCGAVLINDIPTFRIESMPYGGVKESGFGREGPAYAIREMTDEKLLIFSL